MSDQNANRPPLLPDRHPTPDFFVCDIFDAAPKGDMASMEYPIFSLSTKPDRRVRRYELRDRFVEITPSVLGLATIHDRDVLIYCISQLIAAANSGHEISQVVRFKAHDLLIATNRMTNGQAYDALKTSLERLRGTTISTNIITGGEEQLDVFGLIERAKIVRQTREGRMQEVEVKLSDWVFNAIRSNEVLTLHRDYFRLRKPLERRLYELARKHCGMQSEWRVRLPLLQKKCGSNSSLREFRRLLQTIVQEDLTHAHLPDYAITFDGEEDMVIFRQRNLSIMPRHQVDIPSLDPDIYEMARALAPGWDVHLLEREWRDWLPEPPRNAEAAYLGFCRKWFETRGRP